MPDVFTKAKRSEVMSRIRGRGNKETELALAKVLRQHGIKGWRRHFEIRGRDGPAVRPYLSCETRLCFPAGAARTIRGWLFLARLSEARHQAKEQSRVLAAKTFRKQEARPAGEPDVASGDRKSVV